MDRSFIHGIFNKKASPKKETTKNPLIFRQKTSLKIWERLSLSASLGSTFFCLDLDWITNKGLSSRDGDQHVEFPSKTENVNLPTFWTTILHKKKKTKVFIKWCCVAVTKTCDFAGLGVFWLFLFCSKTSPTNSCSKTQYLLGLLRFFSPKWRQDKWLANDLNLWNKKLVDASWLVIEPTWGISPKWWSPASNQRFLR